jgi:flagellar motor switch protein FliG
MEGVFVFDDVINVENNVVKEILNKVSSDDLTKALIREDEKIRKFFYRNMSLEYLQIFDKKLKTIDSFTGYEKRWPNKKYWN